MMTAWGVLAMLAWQSALLGLAATVANRQVGVDAAPKAAA